MHPGARPADPAPAGLPRAANGTDILAVGEPVEIDRKVHRDYLDLDHWIGAKA
ncbi:hypothetical protein [Streptomyces sp. NBC_01361]|uniref:hypothetical protein n=1 Tax=Streptomyces sp. NBC_01361 TaxID=2903838 RepID=UPI002E30F2C1|nr:hypothetical protein [Streptomyces sp. NBC_01361]